MRKIWFSSKMLVQLVVELLRALQVDTERLLHDDPGVLDQPSLADQASRRPGPTSGAPTSSAAAGRRRPVRFGLGDGRQRPRASRGGGHVVEVTAKVSHSSSVNSRLKNSSIAARANARNSSAEVVQGHPDDPTAGNQAGRGQVEQAGRSLRRARSPVAPNRITTCGWAGPLPGCILTTCRRYAPNGASGRSPGFRARPCPAADLRVRRYVSRRYLCRGSGSPST